MSQFRGTALALRFSLRRDRFLLPICIAGLIGWVVLNVVSYVDLYSTQAQLNQLYKASAGNPALVAMVGPTDGLRTIGGATAWKLLPFGALFGAVFAMFVVVRHSRAEEEDGRSELLLSSGSGRFASLTAAVLISAGALATVAVGWMVVLLAAGYEASSSLLMSLAVFGFGLLFTGIAAFCAQVTDKARTARGLAGILIALSWLLRAIGDTGPEALSWLSPLGWVQHTNVYWDDHWWPLALLACAALLSTGIAFSLLLRRDIGSGLIQPRPGPDHAHRGLLHPLGFAFRLQRGSIISWSALLFIYGFAIGAVGNNLEDILKSSEALSQAFAGASDNLLDSYFASILTVLGLMAAGFAISGALRPDAEEARDRVAILLAGPLGKVRWAWGHVLIAYAASAVMMVLLGTGLGLGLGVATGDFGRVAQMGAAGLAQAPAIWLTASLAVLLFGISTRIASLAWGLLGFFVVVWTVGSFQNLPDWISDLSPFSHVSAVPAVPLELTPLILMTVLAAALTAGGLALWRHRDLL